MKEKVKKHVKREKKSRQGFFAEFKKFITRGNVVDMAVGVIVGGAFTAIVNAVSNSVLKPLINWLLAIIFKKDALTDLYTFLGEKQFLADGTVDLENSIYIDWGAVINAVLNFILIALVLFMIVRTINRVRARANAKELAAAAEKAKEEEEKKAAEEAAAKEAAEAAAAALEQFYANVARQTELLEKMAADK